MNTSGSSESNSSQSSSILTAATTSRTPLVSILVILVGTTRFRVLLLYIVPSVCGLHHALSLFKSGRRSLLTPLDSGTVYFS